MNCMNAHVKGWSWHLEQHPLSGRVLCKCSPFTIWLIYFASFHLLCRIKLTKGFVWAFMCAVCHLRPLHLGQSHRSCLLHRLEGREEEKHRSLWETPKSNDLYDKTGRLGRVTKDYMQHRWNPTHTAAVAYHMSYKMYIFTPWHCSKSFVYMHEL